ncbi:MAG: HAD family hydrolase [Sedimentisphaerales bacterium]|nr:HAD family hydrolase [Sedimentisphaerales bacterium]
MKPADIERILASITEVKIAVYGDFCLDAYWILDAQGSEVSVETGLAAQAVSRHYYSLGGAANIVANLAALKPASITAIGVIGNDIFGREMQRQLTELNVDIKHLLVQTEDFNTVAFGKRYLEDKEQTRIDFGIRNLRSTATDEALAAALEDSLRSCDVVIFNQQVPGSIANEGFIDKVNELFERYDDKIVLFDSRHYADRFKNVYRKTNDLEAAMLNGVDARLGDVIALADVKAYAEGLYGQSGKPVFVTRGPRGILTVDGTGVHEVPGIQLQSKLDTVGAGDTTISALGLCLAAGVDPAMAAEFANLAAAVTVQKLFQTGTANPDEVRAIGADPDYIYQPELAEDSRQADYFQGTEIEICCDRGAVNWGLVRHAIFDHDGTISTLRQGWEAVMVPVMIKAILGEQYKTADETLYHQVRHRVLDYIDSSTGIQTILQMEHLVEMVREFGIVPKDQILDKFGYKEIYNAALMELVNLRVDKFKQGRRGIEDYTMKGAVDFLRMLRDRGVTLYLASGTDDADVRGEAEALGYASLFNGGIYGSVGDISKYSKKMVVERIMTENDLQGAELAFFGDGPVEMRECRKRNGLAIGLASDEIRRYDLSLEKRKRLIKAGAHVIVPDFSQPQQLLKLVVGEGA